MARTATLAAAAVVVATLAGPAAAPAAAGARAAATPAAAGPAPVVLRGVPGGFDQVLAVVPVTPAGRSIAGTSGGVHGDLVVAKGAVTAPARVVITSARLAAIPPSRIEVPAAQARLKPVYGLGLLFERGGSLVGLHGLATVTFRSPRLGRADYVAVYYTAHHSFVPAHRHWARCGPGSCLVKLPASTAVVVLGP